MKTFRFAAIFFCLFGSIGFSQVRTWVSPTGLDTNPCTREQPCRNFAAAITAVADGGEVVALESAGYGPVTIAKSVTIAAPNGVHAAIAPATGIAITVNAGDTGQVVLRNLYLNSQGADYGIDADMVAALYIESCVVSGFDLDGILFNPTTSGARLYVSNTPVLQSGNIGLRIVGGTGIRAMIDSVRLHQNPTGVQVATAEATIRNSAVGGATFGFYALSGSKILVENSVAVSNSIGFYATGGGVMTVTRCAATSNASYGIRADDPGTTIYVSDSTISANVTGLGAFSGSAILSRTNNTLQANTSAGAFSGTFGPD